MTKYIVHKAIELRDLSKSSALAEVLKLRPDHLEKTFWRQTKYDGCNCVAIWDGKELKFRSRTGEVVHSMDHLRDSFESLAPGTYLGEAWLRGLAFQEISGAFRRKVARAGGPLLKLVVFDYLTPEEWEAGLSNAPYRERLKRMYIPEAVSEWVDGAHTVLPDDAGEEDLGGLAASLQSRGGFDGLILRDPEGTWSAGDEGKNGEIIKVKPRLRVSCRVTGYLAGKGKHQGRVGTLLVEYKGVEQGAGTGLSDFQRDIGYYHSVWKKAIVEIEALGETPDGRLREPVLVGFRHDVLQPD